MTNKVLDMLNSREAYLLKTLESLEKKLVSYPEGKINIRPNKSGYSYFLHKDKTYKYLNRKDTELIKQYIQKDLISNAIKTAKIEKSFLRKLLNKYPVYVIDDQYERLPENRMRFATPIFLNNEEYAQYWLSIPFTPKPIGKDCPEFYTQKGEHVRSKSEVIIADRLYAKGIPYKYECPIMIGDELIHPDFTILRLSNRKILYHEHCGKMGDACYVEDFLDRVNKYGRAGIFTGDRLFFTFESSNQPLDISWLDEFIEKNYR